MLLHHHHRQVMVQVGGTHHLFLVCPLQKCSITVHHHGLDMNTMSHTHHLERVEETAHRIIAHMEEMDHITHLIIIVTCMGTATDMGTTMGEAAMSTAAH